MKNSERDKVSLGMAVCLALAACVSASAQPAATDALVASDKASMVPYDISSAGVKQSVRWGIDTAWMWSWWPLRATNHMQECAELGRVTIDPRVSGSYTAMSSDQLSHFTEQLSWLKKSGVTQLYLLAGNASGTAWQTSYRTTFIKDIELAVTYLQSKGYTVTAIAPFNEPDYGANNAPSAAEMATVARLLRQNAVLKDIDIAGPNCLNPDYAYAWWGTMSGSLQIGNTHQLAGTFDSYAGFFAAVQASGKKGACDELHNINDALIGMNYGMTDGIWWSDFGSYTRAELGRASNDGVRIGYAENRAAWTSAAVFRRTSEPLVEAFLGTSERQAGESAYCFVSQDRLAYYDGHGPCYDYTQATAGGTGYGVGQTNSEYVIEVTHGEDVPVAPLDGTFKLVNKATGKLLTAASLSADANITQAKESRTAQQSWLIKPVGVRDAGDFAHVTIAAAKNTSLYLDALKYGGDNGARVLLYNGSGNECERWHLRYKGDGYYTITNNDSGLSLEGSANNTATNTTGVTQWARTGTDRQLWRLVPATATVESEAPATPAGLQAEGRSGSIRLTWTANTEADLLGYMVYRYNTAAAEWETIGRRVTATEFTDNYCAKGTAYRYRIRAIDQAWNISEPSAEATASTAAAKALIGEWHLGSDLLDHSENALHAAATAAVTFATGDTHAGAVLDGSTGYVALPYHVADMAAMTFCAWVKPASTTAWQRIFDFGRSTDNYFFLTPSNGSRLRLEICHDGQKQGLNATKRLTANQWTHVVVTLSAEGASIYLDGKLDATSSAVTFTPADVHPTLSYIGRSMFDADPLFKGTIGDVRLYNYALPAADVAALFYQDQIDAAADLAAQPMNKDVRAPLTEAIATAHNAISSGDSEAITTALAALTTAMKSVQSSVKAYSALGEMLGWSQSLAEAHPQADAEALAAYDTAYDDIHTAYLQGDYADADITAVCTDVRTLTNRYLMADASKVTTRFTDITHLLLNADFADGTTDGWQLTTNSSSNYHGACAYGCFEVWNHTFKLSQTLPGMPAGTYRLQVQGFYRNGAKINSASTDVNALLFIGDDTAPIAPISRSANSSTSDGDWYEYATNKKVPNDMQAAAAAFNKLNRYKPTTTVNAVTTDYDPTAAEALTLGLLKTKAVADDWTIVNQFTLSYKASETDGIDDVNLSTNNSTTINPSTKCYDLSGRAIVSGNLPRGTYIIDGRKVVVR